MENCEGRDWQKDWELVELLALFEWGFIPDTDGGVIRRALIREHLALRYWLQQVRELKQRVKKLEAQVEWCRWAEECPKYKDGLLRRVSELEKENYRLRAVAKAAKLVVDEWLLPGKPMMGAPIRQLQDALAELEGDKNGHSNMR